MLHGWELSRTRILVLGDPPFEFSNKRGSITKAPCVAAHVNLREHKIIGQKPGLSTKVMVGNCDANNSQV